MVDGGALLSSLRELLGSGRIEDFSGLDSATCELAIAQGVGPLLYEHAGRTATDAAHSVRGALQRSFYRSLLRNESLLKMADRACEALHSEGIATVRIKGADLLSTVYPSVATRPMDDVDLLVNDEHAPRAIDVLERCGFRRPDVTLPLEFYLEHHLHVALIDEQGGGYLELHWQLMDHFKRGGLDGTRAVSTAVPWRDGRPELGLRLSSDLRYIYTALHIDKHGPFHEVLLQRGGAARALFHASSEARLLWLLDLAKLQRWEALDGVVIAGFARELGVARGVWTTLSMVEDLLGREYVPEGLVEALEPAIDGRLRRCVVAMTGAFLESRSALARRLVARAMRMDEAAQVRPLRLLQLPLHLVTPAAEGSSVRRRVSGPMSDLWRAARMAGSMTRHRVQRRRSAGTG